MTRRLGLAAYIPLLSTTPVFAAKRGTADLKRHCAGYATTSCGDVDPEFWDRFMPEVVEVGASAVP